VDISKYFKDLRRIIYFKEGLGYFNQGINGADPQYIGFTNERTEMLDLIKQIKIFKVPKD
jgi:hypothetical protein